MCLENNYVSGRHAIGEHSDDERSMGRLRDVFCWIAGPARRIGIFRARRNADQTLRMNKRTREVLRVALPEGLYVMHGACFQREYTHEFPQLNPRLFDVLTDTFDALRPDDYPAEPSVSEHGANRTPLVKAEWFVTHHARVEPVLADEASTRQRKRRRRAAGTSLVDEFREWCKWRVSYTLRGFDDAE